MSVAMGVVLMYCHDLVVLSLFRAPRGIICVSMANTPVVITHYCYIMIDQSTSHTHLGVIRLQWTGP